MLPINEIIEGELAISKQNGKMGVCLNHISPSGLTENNIELIASLWKNIFGANFYQKN
jgi:hypothetical protein